MGCLEGGCESAVNPRVNRQEWATAYLALGSNEGEREASLAFAVSELRQHPAIDVVASSPIYETDPIGPGSQSRYLNAVLRVATSLAAAPLLEVMLRIERRAGRARERTRWAPRPLDLDLLLYDDACIDRPGLEVPHPRLHERAFVLVPLLDLAPDLIHPVLAESITTLARRVDIHRGIHKWPRELPIPR